MALHGHMSAHKVSMITMDKCTISRHANGRLSLLPGLYLGLTFFGSIGSALGLEMAAH